MGREGTLPSKTVTLRVLIEDGLSMMADVDTLPVLYIYDSSFTEEAIVAEADAEIYTGLGPFTATRISVGYYEYVYTVPNTATAGTWKDLWLYGLDSTAGYEIFEFEVIVGATAVLQDLRANQLIVIELAASIAGLTSGETLGEKLQLSYSTIYNPLYASVDLLRAEVGSWIDMIPDDTINLMIHFSSKEVDVITPVTFNRVRTVPIGDWISYQNGNVTKRPDLFAYARTKYCVYDAAWRLLQLPATAFSGNVVGSGRSKRLGDLLIQEGKGGLNGAGGLTSEQITMIKEQRDEWWRVVNAKGSIVPGQSLDPTYALRGIMDPDRRRQGRLWESSEDVYYPQPVGNFKGRRYGSQLYRFRNRG